MIREEAVEEAIEGLEILDHKIKISEKNGSYIVEKKQVVKHPKENIHNMIRGWKKRIDNIEKMLLQEKEMREHARSEAKKIMDRAEHDIEAQISRLKSDVVGLRENIAVWEKSIGVVNVKEERESGKGVT
jgi:predicted  nucleic acid-binding Zn-ribbon protein